MNMVFPQVYLLTNVVDGCSGIYIDGPVGHEKEKAMHRTQKYTYSALFIIGLCTVSLGIGCMKEEKFMEGETIEDNHPTAGTKTVLHMAQKTEWKAYAVHRGDERGAELHLEKLGKHVLLPDAVPLGFSPDGSYLLFVWTPPNGTVSGLAAMNLAKNETPMLLTDASKIPTPGRAQDIRWNGHTIEYDLLGEEDRLTVSIDLDTAVVQMRVLKQ